MIHTNDRCITEVMRDEMTMREKILSLLNSEPKTIPEIAKELEYPANEVMVWIMAMWRYGYIEEVGKANAEGYYKYQQINRDKV